MAPALRVVRLRSFPDSALLVWIPTTRVHVAAHALSNVVIVSDANRRAIEEEGVSFLLGAKLPDADTTSFGRESALIADPDSCA